MTIQADDEQDGQLKAAIFMYEEQSKVICTLLNKLKGQQRELELMKPVIDAVRDCMDEGGTFKYVYQAFEKMSKHE